MRPKRMIPILGALLCAAAAYILYAPGSASANPRSSPLLDNETAAGALYSLDDQGQPAGLCPLKHTSVKAKISGFLARVTVTQEFHNPFNDKIEAVYTFPLPQKAAVDDMTLLVGERTIRGLIKERGEARRIYDAARNAGHVAGLLDQERPNIFTQAVANIEPGAKVTVAISYVETLPYDEGSYEFSFPMVVGPRYIPGNATGKQGTGWAHDTSQVPDASRITPPVTPKGTRAGHDISVQVELDAGVPVTALRSKTHEVLTERPAREKAVVRLAKKSVIPNKDFVLRYDVEGQKIEDAVLTHHSGKSGFFTMILQPPERVTVEDVTPKELVFVIDTSGSMSGFPIEKAKETMKLAIDGLYPRDTFNLITFAGSTKVLFPAPVPATPENLAKAQEFLASQRGGGGTEMMTAIRTALEPSDSQEHVRIVSFMTDGYVGNDMAILDEIQKHPNARIFSFGIGSSTNRFLLDKMAELGRGEVEYVALNDDGSAAARRFHERIRNPLLTDIEIDWAGLPIEDVYPKRIPDLFSAKPVVLSGRYTGPGLATMRLKGRMAGQRFERKIPVRFSKQAPEHDVLATLWARTRIDDLMKQDFAGIQNGNPKAGIKSEITQLGIDYRLMTQFTSFVAVEETVVTEGGKPRTVAVPVEMPDGVSYEGVFGDGGNVQMANMRMSSPAGQSIFPSTGQSLGGALRYSTDQAAASPAVEVVEERKSGKAGEERGRRENERDASTATTNLPQGIGAKLHPSLVSLLSRSAMPGFTATAEESAYVIGNKVAVQVWLAGASVEVLAQLKQLGFEESGKARVANIRLGRIDISKLAALAQVTGVRYVTPLTN